MTDADLRDSDMTNAQIAGAKMNGARMEGTTGVYGQKFGSTGPFKLKEKRRKPWWMLWAKTA